VVGRVDPRGVALVGAAAVLVGVLSGCGHANAGDPIGAIQDVAAQKELAQGMADAFQPNLTVNPPDGASGVSPTEAVTAVVAGGRLTQADLRTQDGAKLDGALSPDGARWASSNPLKPNTSYVLTTVVRATSGEESTTATKFTTLAPGQQVAAKITPNDGETISGATPISVVFDKPIGDRGAVERALVVTSNPPGPGSARWRTDRELVWQPTGAWDPGTQVIATLDFFGKQVGPGLYGGSDVRSTFRVGQLGGPMPVDPANADLSQSLDPNSPDLGSPVPPDLAAAGPGGANLAGPGPGTVPGAVHPNAAPNPVASPHAASPHAASPHVASPNATSPSATGPDAATTPDPALDGSPDAVVPDTTPRDDSDDDSSPPKPKPTRKPTLPVLQ
jgi:hypothetical protein